MPAEAMPRPGRPSGARLRLLLLLPPLLLLPGSYAGNLTVAVVLPLTNTSYPWSWARVGPAVELALARVKARPDLLPGWTVRTVPGSSVSALGVCSDTAAPLAAVDLKWEHSPAVFLGPGCVYAAAPVGRFTAQHHQNPRKCTKQGGMSHCANGLQLDCHGTVTIVPHAGKASATDTEPPGQPSSRMGEFT